MDKMTIVLDEFKNEHALIEHEDGSFSSMPLEVYEARQVEHLTSPLTNQPDKDVL
jgi:hypothetical protein